MLKRFRFACVPQSSGAGVLLYNRQGSLKIMFKSVQSVLQYYFTSIKTGLKPTATEFGAYVPLLLLSGTRARDGTSP